MCSCGNFVYSGARRDGRLLCWDIRHTGEALYAASGHSAATNQRLAFSIEPCGRHLAIGGCRGCLSWYDLVDGALVATHALAEDTIAGVSVHPTKPLVATASGHRRFVDPEDGVPRWGLTEGSACNELAVWQIASRPFEAAPEGSADVAAAPAASDSAGAAGQFSDVSDA